MDSIKPFPAPSRSKIVKTLSRIVSFKNLTKSRSSSKLRCDESKLFDEERVEEAMAELRSKESMEAFMAKLLAELSSVKAAYAEMQMAQFPYSEAAVQAADQAVVDELWSLSELKRRFEKNQIETSSPPHVAVMVAEMQEQQALMRTYEITMKKMQMEIDQKSSQISSLQEKLDEIRNKNGSMEKKMNTDGSYSVLETVKFDGLNVNDFIVALQYALRSLRHFIKHLIREMQASNWDIDAAAAAAAIHPGVEFTRRDHKPFAFESFVCGEMFSGFGNPFFGIEKFDQDLAGEKQRRRSFFFGEYEKLRSVSASHFVEQNPDSLFKKFLKSRYLRIVHPKMELSFSGNLNQRKAVNAGEFPSTDFFKMFAEMSRRIWLLHCLAFSLDREVGIFRVQNNSRFSELYMVSVAADVFTEEAGDLLAAFTVVPGFQFGHTVVQSQVYLVPAMS